MGLLDAARETHRLAASTMAAALQQVQRIAPLVTRELVADEAAGNWQRADAQAQPLQAAGPHRPPPFDLLIAMPLLTETLLRAGVPDLARALLQARGGSASQLRMGS